MITHRLITPVVVVAVGLGLLASCAPRVTSPLRELPEKSDTLVAKPLDRYEATGLKDMVAGFLPSSDKLAEQYLAALPEKERPLVTHNPMLDFVAFVYAAGYAEWERLPASTLTTWLFWKFGIVSVSGGSYAVWARGPGAAGNLEDKLRDSAGQLKTDGTPHEFGVARVGMGSRMGLAVVTARRNVEIKDLPKKYKPGDTLTLSGRIVAPYDQPALYFDRGGADVGRKTITTDANGAFTVSAKLPDKPGRYFVEITTLDPGTKGKKDATRWQKRLMLVPVYVGQEEPTKPDQMIANPPPNPPDRSLWAHRILELYNAERKSHGLPPLALSVEASAVASERSAELASNEDLPPDTALEDKLARRGLVTRHVYQSSAHLNSVDETAWHSLLSPSHRRSILGKKASLAGIGITQKDEHQYAGIEYIVTPLPPLDVNAKKAALFDAVNTLRTAKGKQAFKPFPPAELALDEFANGVCSGEIQYGKLDPLNDLLKKHKVSYTQAQTLMVMSRYFTKKGLKRAGYEELVDSDKGALAIGVCRGDLPDLPRGELVIFLMIQPAGSVALAQ